LVLRPWSAEQKFGSGSATKDQGLGTKDLLGKPHPNFTGEVTSSYKKRIEGVRVKHYLKGNSLKMYDKAGCVLRIETTLGNVSDFKVLRPTNDTDPDAKLTWNKMRKGVADLHRRAELSQRSNDRYLDALAVVDVLGRNESGLAVLGP
jgi:hypothetical protein